MSAVSIYLSSDHAGCALRQLIFDYLEGRGNKVFDLGPYNTKSVDYPDYGIKLANALKPDPSARGIAICGSGIGISIAVNRFAWIRGALVSNVEAAVLSRQHNDANVLVLGERLVDPKVALECTDAFLTTVFQGGRHQRRIERLTTIGVKR